MGSDRRQAGLGALRKVDLLILVMQGYDLAKMPNSQTSVTHLSGLGDDVYYFAMTSGQYMELRVNLLCKAQSCLGRSCC